MKVQRLQCIGILVLAGLSVGPSYVGAGDDAFEERPVPNLAINWDAVRACRARQLRDETGNVESALRHALEWIRSNQQEDGSWGPPHRLAATALSLLALMSLGDGTPEDEERLEQAVAFLVARQDESGGFANLDGRIESVPHALATLALVEVAMQGGREDLGEVIATALGAIVQSQQPGGGWYHSIPATRRSQRYARRHTAVSAWQLQTLHAARLAGLEIPEIDRVLRRARGDLLAVQDLEDGQFGLETRGIGGLGATGAGVYALQLIGDGQTYAAMRGVEALSSVLTERAGGERWSLDDTFLVTQALFHHGGQLWRDGYRQLLAEVLSHQGSDGSWQAPDSDPAPGVPQTTATCALLLRASGWYPSLRQAFVGREGPLLWRTEINGTTMFILAGFPLNEPGIYLADDRIWSAFRQAPSLYLQEEVRDIEESIQDRARYKAGDQTFNDLFSETALAEIDDALSAFGLTTSEVAVFKPWYLAMLFLRHGLDENSLPTQDGIPGFLMASKQPPQTVSYLLKGKDYVGILEHLPAKQQEALLVYSLTALDQITSLLRNMNQLWCTGDREAIERTMEDYIESNPALAPLFEHIVAPLNRRITVRLEAAADGKASFVVLDLWHVLGSNGVLRQLEDRGYDVERL